MTIKDKIIACYKHIKARSIHKVVGCSNNYVYQVLREEGFKIPNYTLVKDKVPTYLKSRWKNI